MFKISFAALTATAALLASAPGALAGDLGDGGYGSHRYGEHRPYYSGQDNGRQDYDHSDDQSDDDDDDDTDHAGNRNDDDDDDNGGNDDFEDQHAYQRDGSTKDGGDEDRHGRAGCVPGWKVKQRLIGEGWSHFKLSTYGRGEAIIRATRVHTGRKFELRLDGCTGQTLSSYPLDRGRRYSSRD
jgi:hypothetical protein